MRLGRPEVMGNMKDGDYMIHVFLQCGHSFKDDDGEDTVNPLVVIESCGLKAYSKSYSRIPVKSENKLHWNEHIFLEPKKMVSS